MTDASSNLASTAFIDASPQRDTPLRITLLAGGPSAERAVSLVSGAAVAGALREGGHVVFESDIGPGDLSGLERPCDVVFPVLHGAFGESGELQEILEERGMRFVGSGSAASRQGMDKIATKRLWHEHGLPTPQCQVLTRPPVEPACFGLPTVVKAIRSGSSIDVVIAESAGEVTAAAVGLLTRHPVVMHEQYVLGTELTIGLLQGRALDPIRIVTRRGFFDYDAKYAAGGAEHHFDLNLPADVVEQCKSLAVAAHDVLGCRDLARVDLIVDAHNCPWLLEINTMPGFTATSLLPEAAARAGVPFVVLVDRLARAAAGRA